MPRAAEMIRLVRRAYSLMYASQLLSSYGHRLVGGRDAVLFLRRNLGDDDLHPCDNFLDFRTSRWRDLVADNVEHNECRCCPTVVAPTGNRHRIVLFVHLGERSQGRAPPRHRQPAHWRRAHQRRIAQLYVAQR